MWPFKRKNFASPYYGKGNRALFTSPPMIPQQQEELPKSTSAPVQVIKREPAEPDWELRRFAIKELQTHPFKSHDEEADKADV